MHLTPVLPLAGYFLTRIPELAAEVGIPPGRVINLHTALGGTGKNEPECFKSPELFVDNWWHQLAFIMTSLACAACSHMNDAGYALMAETIFNVVAPELASQPAS